MSKPYLRNCATPEVHIYTTVADLPEDWDRLLPEAHPLKSSTLSVYEAITLPDISSYYALYGNPGNIVAIACFQVLKVLPKHLNTEQLRGWQLKMVPRLLAFFKPSLLVAGHLFRHDIPNFYASPFLSNLESFRTYEAMTKAVGRQSCAVATLVKDVPDYLIPYFQNFAPHYNPLRNDISMRMALPAEWATMGDYETALKHKYAQRFRKIRSGLQDLQIKELDWQAVQADAATLFQLYEQVSRKQSFSMGLLNEHFLPALKQYYGDKLKVWAFYENGQMVAFASAWLHEDAFDMFYIGFDYERNNVLNLYFNILYFSIEQAIFYRKPLLILGRTALEAKARLGCTPHYLSTYLLVRSPFLRRFVGGKINAQHQQEGAWEERHPFKKSRMAGKDERPNS